MNAWDPSHLRAAPPKPKTTWQWIVFGDPNMLVVTFVVEVSLWRRMITRFILGSKWKKL